MAFQLQCPQGHLLVAQESQAGQQCVCPMCGILFIIPMPMVMPAPPMPPPAPPSLPPVAPSYPEPQEVPGDRFAALAAAAAAAESEAIAPQPVPDEMPAPPAEPILLHIPCPNGHDLETPEEMLDREVLCPHCNAQFVLRRQNSLEFKRKKEEDERIRAIKAESFWLKWAIAAVVLVLLGLVALIVMRNLVQTPASQ